MANHSTSSAIVWRLDPPSAGSFVSFVIGMDTMNRYLPLWRMRDLLKMCAELYAAL